MENKKLTLNYLLLFFIAVTIVVQVFILNKHSTMGDQLSLINQKINEAETDNNQISQKIASLSAMTVIADEAKHYGLTAPSSVLSLAGSLPLAANLRLSF